jgi:hypothetical protein
MSKFTSFLKMFINHIMIADLQLIMITSQNSLTFIINVRGVSRFLKLGGQELMRSDNATATATALLSCQKLDGQLPTLPIRQLRP